MSALNNVSNVSHPFSLTCWRCGPRGKTKTNENEGKTRTILCQTAGLRTLGQAPKGYVHGADMHKPTSSATVIIMWMILYAERGRCKVGTNIAISQFSV